MIEAIKFILVVLIAGVGGYWWGRWDERDRFGRIIEELLRKKP